MNPLDAIRERWKARVLIGAAEYAAIAGEAPTSIVHRVTSIDELFTRVKTEIDALETRLTLALNEIEQSHYERSCVWSYNEHLQTHYDKINRLYNKGATR